MAKADAWGAPGGMLFGQRVRSKRRDRTSDGEPALHRLLAAEPVLRRAIPTLIVAFLVVVAAARVLSLTAMHEDDSRSARALLSMAAGGVANGLAAETAPDTIEIEALLATTREQGMLSANHVLLVLNKDFEIVATNPDKPAWRGQPLHRIVTGAEPLSPLAKAPAPYRWRRRATIGLPRWLPARMALIRPLHWCRRQPSSPSGCATSNSTSRSSWSRRACC